ncbi:MAG: helix-turn-helix domain-containing protein [Chloroflexi bacterium]|nr:helix-turn-helix domain-containing protein [Chloroflexota bacterium]
MTVMSNYQGYLAWSERIRDSPLAAEVVASLEGRAPEIWRRTFDLLRKESPEYRNAVDDEFTVESKSHCGELLATIVAIGAGRLKGSDPFTFVRKHAEWRARHQVPLVASLHAYRLAHKTYWGITREQLTQHRKRKVALEALAILSDFWIELFEAVGAMLEEAHSAEEARIVAQNSQVHAAVIEDLLNGTEPTSAEGRHLLTLCGIRPAKKVTVALIRPLAPDSKQVDAEVSRRSFVRLLQQVLPSSVFGKLAGLRNGEVVVIANSDADTAARLCKYLGRSGAGKRGAPGAFVGTGLDKAEIARLPEALSEARIALDLTSPGRALVGFSEIELNEALAHRADRAVLRLIPSWVRESHASGNERDLLDTIRAFAQCSLNVKETAGKLRVHTNTVYFRLNQIKKRTGVDPRTFAGTSLLITALRLLDNQDKQNGHGRCDGD